MATKFRNLTALNDKLFIFPTSYSKAKNENTMPCLRKLPSTLITNKLGFGKTFDNKNVR